MNIFFTFPLDFGNRLYAFQGLEYTLKETQQASLRCCCWRIILKHKVKKYEDFQLYQNLSRLLNMFISSEDFHWTIMSLFKIGCARSHPNSSRVPQIFWHSIPYHLDRFLSLSGSRLIVAGTHTAASLAHLLTHYLLTTHLPDNSVKTIIIRALFNSVFCGRDETVGHRYE